MTTDLTNFMYVNWTLVLFSFTVLFTVLYQPTYQIITNEYTSFVNMVFSIPFMVCLIPTLIGQDFLRCKLQDNPNDLADALWHLTNATWWSFGLDVFSGLLGIMPNFTIYYQIMDVTHLMGFYERATLDTIYLCELFIHIPLSWICVYLYYLNNPCRHPVELFLSGIQLMGTIAYYLPGILQGGSNLATNKFITVLNLALGMIWIIKPIYILKKHIAINQDSAKIKLV